MKITNPSDLPQAIVDAVTNDAYSRGDADYSITDLLQAPHKLKLQREHDDDIEETADARIWSLIGQAVHSILERAGLVDLKEKRFYMTIDGVRVSGQPDNFAHASKRLSDYKVTSVWTVVYPHPEWELQVACGYTELLRANGYDVGQCEIVAILRDWSKREAARDPSYPQTQVVTLRFEPWTREKAQAFLAERVRLHEAARTADPPVCSAEERWEKPTTYAIKKPAAGRAIRVLPTLAEARAFQEADPKAKGTIIEERPGESTRCLHYCNAAPFCQFGRSLKEPA